MKKSIASISIKNFIEFDFDGCAFFFSSLKIDFNRIFVIESITNFDGFKEIAFQSFCFEMHYLKIMHCLIERKKRIVYRILCDLWNFQRQKSNNNTQLNAST